MLVKVVEEVMDDDQYDQYDGVDEGEGAASSSLLLLLNVVNPFVPAPLPGNMTFSCLFCFRNSSCRESLLKLLSLQPRLPTPAAGCR